MDRREDDYTSVFKEPYIDGKILKNWAESINCVNVKKKSATEVGNGSLFKSNHFPELIRKNVVTLNPDISYSLRNLQLSQNRYFKVVFKKRENFPLAKSFTEFYKDLTVIKMGLIDFLPEMNMLDSDTASSSHTCARKEISDSSESEETSDEEIESKIDPTCHALNYYQLKFNGDQVKESNFENEHEAGNSKALEDENISRKDDSSVKSHIKGGNEYMTTSFSPKVDKTFVDQTESDCISKVTAINYAGVHRNESQFSSNFSKNCAMKDTPMNEEITDSLGSNNPWVDYSSSSASTSSDEKEERTIDPVCQILGIWREKQKESQLNESFHRKSEIINKGDFTDDGKGREGIVNELLERSEQEKTNIENKEAKRGESSLIPDDLSEIRFHCSYDDSSSASSDEREDFRNIDPVCITIDLLKAKSEKYSQKSEITDIKASKNKNIVPMCSVISCDELNPSTNKTKNDKPLDFQHNSVVQEDSFVGFTSAKINKNKTKLESYLLIEKSDSKIKVSKRKLNCEMTKLGKLNSRNFQKKMSDDMALVKKRNENCRSQRKVEKNIPDNVHLLIASQEKEASVNLFSEEESSIATVKSNKRVLVHHGLSNCVKKQFKSTSEKNIEIFEKKEAICHVKNQSRLISSHSSPSVKKIEHIHRGKKRNLDVNNIVSHSHIQKKSKLSSQSSNDNRPLAPLENVKNSVLTEESDMVMMCQTKKQLILPSHSSIGDKYVINNIVKERCLKENLNMQTIIEKQHHHAHCEETSIPIDKEKKISCGVKDNISLSEHKQTKSFSSQLSSKSFEAIDRRKKKCVAEKQRISSTHTQKNSTLSSPSLNDNRSLIKDGAKKIIRENEIIAGSSKLPQFSSELNYSSLETVKKSILAEKQDLVHNREKKGNLEKQESLISSQPPRGEKSVINVSIGEKLDAPSSPKKAASQKHEEKSLSIDKRIKVNTKVKQDLLPDMPKEAMPFSLQSSIIKSSRNKRKQCKPSSQSTVKKTVPVPIGCEKNMKFVEKQDSLYEIKKLSKMSSFQSNNHSLNEKKCISSESEKMKMMEEKLNMPPVMDNTEKRQDNISNISEEAKLVTNSQSIDNEKKITLEEKDAFIKIRTSKILSHSRSGKNHIFSVAEKRKKLEAKQVMEKQSKLSFSSQSSKEKISIVEDPDFSSKQLILSSTINDGVKADCNISSIPPEVELYNTHLKTPNEPFIKSISRRRKSITPVKRETSTQKTTMVSAAHEKQTCSTRKLKSVTSNYTNDETKFKNKDTQSIISGHKSNFVENDSSNENKIRFENYSDLEHGVKKSNYNFKIHKYLQIDSAAHDAERMERKPNCKLKTTPSNQKGLMNNDRGNKSNSSQSDLDTQIKMSNCLSKTLTPVAKYFPTQKSQQEIKDMYTNTTMKSPLEENLTEKISTTGESTPSESYDPDPSTLHTLLPEIDFTEATALIILDEHIAHVFDRKNVINEFGKLCELYAVDTNKYINHGNEQGIRDLDIMIRCFLFDKLNQKMNCVDKDYKIYLDISLEKFMAIYKIMDEDVDKMLS